MNFHKSFFTLGKHLRSSALVVISLEINSAFGNYNVTQLTIYMTIYIQRLFDVTPPKIFHCQFML